jgi:Hypoxia induced protein conserved region
VFAGAIGTGLLLGLWNMISGHSEDDSQSFMRFRVAAQFATICVIMAMLYVSAV